MKKIILYIGTFALLITSCFENPAIDITSVTPPLPPATNYNTAECTYYGDILGDGTAFFLLNLYQSSNPSVGLYIRGWCTKPNSFAGFQLDQGTYTLATSGVKTYVAGATEANGTTGTTLYNLTTNTYTLITGGSFTVDLSGNTYTISANFTGKDASTGIANNDIRINFTGSINFVDNSTITNSTYVATGTPVMTTPLGPGTWSGRLYLGQQDTLKWYNITNFSNLNRTVMCDYYDNGIIQIDNYSEVYSDDTHDYYFDLAYIDGGGTLRIFLDDLKDSGYSVHYNPLTGVLDFTGTVTRNGVTYEALVGIAGYNKTTRWHEKELSNFYAGLKLQLTPDNTTRHSGGVAQQPSDKVTDIADGVNISRLSTTNQIVDKDIHIEIEKKGNSNLKK